MKSMMTKGGLCFCLLLVLCLALGTEALGNGALSHIQRQQARTRGRQQRAAPQTREREGAGVPTSDAWNDNDRAALIEEMRRTHPVRTGHDMPAEEMHEFLQHRANLLFRTLDVNRDRLVTAEDVKDREAVAALHKYMPGVSPQQFTAFIQEADEDGDGGLDNDEFLSALSVGVHRAARHADVQSLLETASQSQSRRRGHHGGRSSDYLGRNRQGFISTMYNYQNARRSDDDGQMSQPSASNNPLEDVMVAASNGRPFEEARFTEVRAGGDEGCVLCQYVLERCETNVKSSGVIPAMTGVNLDGVYLELESHTSGRDVDSDSMLPSAAAPNRKEEANGDNKEDTRMRHEQADREFVSLVETGSSAGYSPMDVAGAAVIGSTRQSTRYQRQLERQKYNEIYRVVDISLDDVCEQGMPNLFYQYCKQIYKAQSDVVDGLRYQYRAADICYKIKMCGPGSYITAGIHSRYKGPPLAQQAPQESFF